MRGGANKCLFVFNAQRNLIAGNRFEGCAIGIHFTAGSETGTRPIAGILQRAPVVRWLDRLTGGVFLGFGVKLALEPRP